jgi:hypothetical protein
MCVLCVLWLIFDKTFMTKRGHSMNKIAVALGTLLILLSLNVEAFSLNLTPIGAGPGTSFRWMDIADNIYSNNYQATYTYQAATVVVAYHSTATAFFGTLTATGLKPSFAYQMKLVGDPSKSVWTNEQLGYSGRWWRVQPNPGNTTDADYDNNKNNPNYIFQGYLLFDFFITDDQGNATIDFTADSSFHVLWATPDSTGNGTGHRNRGSNDGLVRYDDFIASPGKNPYAYATDYGSAHVGVYAEWEPGRVLPGQLILSNGMYNCQFILTEESFHQSGLGGSWAGAMGADILFTIEQTTDLDNDGIPDGMDNCPNKPNSLKLGTCSPTSDKPGINCTSDADCAEGCSTNGKCSMNQEDTDEDGKGDVCDNCPNNCNTEQLDADTDGIGDVCDDPNNDGCGGCGQPTCETPC